VTNKIHEQVMTDIDQKFGNRSRQATITRIAEPGALRISRKRSAWTSVKLAAYH